ncbi:MAG: hypothetical protein QOK37_3666 [Thermoanaerobaculia bacterium]|jgi:hypothetical protein|nr:hypothetical protein [Thermoanaerobaculia bacterium]
MEDIRDNHIETDDQVRDDEREYGAAPRDEVPFHIPRD